MKRDSQRKCFKCGCRTYDPAEDFHPVRKQYAGKDESKKDRYEYICSWCALPLGWSKDFLIRRGGIDGNEEDLNILIDQMRLITDDSPEASTLEEANELKEKIEKFDWYVYSQLGRDFDKKWENYHISYTCVLWATLDKPPGPDFDPFPFTGLLIKDKKDPRKLYWICRIRIRHKESLGFLEIRDGHRLKAEIEIKNLEPETLDSEVNLLWDSRKLFWLLKGKTGPRPKLPTNWQDILKDYMYIWAVFDYNGDGQPPKQALATFYGINRTTLFRRFKKSSITLDGIIEMAEKQFRSIPKEDIPEKYLCVFPIK